MIRPLAIAKGKCPCCGKGDVFEGKRNLKLWKFPEMKTNCDVCGHRFEKEPGFFYGSMYVSYGLGVWEGIVIYLVSRLFITEAFDLRILFIIIASQLLLRVENYRYSRLIWMYMFTRANENCTKEVSSSAGQLS